jgi:hypothetical protein
METEWNSQRRRWFKLAGKKTPEKERVQAGF